jgi:ParB family protein of integrating conjugative element (PFGI_1 class)
MLLAHLKENDLRGELCFLDKAQAVAEVKQLIAAEAETGEVTQTHLAEVLKARGYGLSQGRISQLLYTVQTLLPLIPQALQAGLGRPQVERIRSLDRVARGLWADKVRDDDYDRVFATLCRRYDAPEWDNRCRKFTPHFGGGYRRADRYQHPFRQHGARGTTRGQNHEIGFGRDGR